MFASYKADRQRAGKAKTWELRNGSHVSKLGMACASPADGSGLFLEWRGREGHSMVKQGNS